MARVMITPSKVVLGKGELSNIGSYIRPYGQSALLVAHQEDKDRVLDILDKSAIENDISFIYAKFLGECSETAIKSIEEETRDLEYGCVIGLGGGKGIDTAKIISDKKNIPMISVPTIAATDAPCSALAIVYNDEHIIIGGRPLKRNPALVLIDTEIIAKAPERFLISGMGDAYPTFFEARACRRANVQVNGGQSTLCAFSLAELCLKTLLEKGEQALIACKNNVVTPALEDIIEVNIVMSGIGFESVGVAAAHGLLGPLEVLGASKALHGEIVAFGTLVQLVLENAPVDEIITTINFYRKVGLPLHLSDLGIHSVLPEKLQEAANLAVTEPDALIHNMPFKVSKDSVAAAILAADQLANIY